MRPSPIVPATEDDIFDVDVDSALPATEIETRPPTQAERIFQKFGGARRLAEILNEIGSPRTPCSIYKWNHSKAQRGTGGLIPTTAWPLIFKAARYAGVLITSEDTDPRNFEPKKVHRYQDDVKLVSKAHTRKETK